MKILLVEPGGKLAGHRATYAQYLSEGLLTEGTEIAIVTFDGFLEDWPSKLKVKHFTVTSKVKPIRWMLKPLQLLHSSIFLGALTHGLETIATLLLAFYYYHKERPEIVYLISGLSPFRFLFAPFFRNCNIIIFITQPLAKIIKEKKGKIGLYLIGERILDEIEFIIFHNFLKKRRVTIVCDGWKAFKIFEKTPFRSRLLPLPISELYSKPSNLIDKKEARAFLHLPFDVPIFLFFGTLHPSKDVKVVFEALKELKQKVLILFAGKIEAKGSERDPRKLAYEYNVEEHVQVVDRYIPEEELKFYLCAADACILSFVKGFEAASGALFTASRFSLPVIASDVGKVGRIVKEQNLGITFIPEDPVSLREAMQSFLSLKEEAIKDFKENARRTALISYDVAVKTHLHLFKELMKRSKEISK
jgi:glycosyltransferase involved in cell wall biosynthesis